ncbi:MAG: GAF and ANTAR domain-containing protein [Actinomycetota bacterium]|nr:GAF and ANTAR domain-containing protein [Actinomycetota bacterium]
MAREDLIARTFVELADTLVEDYDPIEFLHHLAERCVAVLGIAEAGLVLVDARGQLQALASSSERMHLIELIEVQRQDGPCLDCWHSGEAVREDHLVDAIRRWPHFAPAALEAGFASAYAVPMRLRDERLGALNLFANEASGLVDTGQDLAQAMADVATIGILHERFIARREEVTEQLQVAFNSRVVLEQAKGVVAQAASIDMDKAFALLRGYARRHNLLLSAVARQVIDRELAAAALAIEPRTQGSRRP